MSIQLPPGRSSFRARTLFARRSVRLWLVVVLAMASMAVIGASVPLASHSASAGAASVCAPDGNNGCLVTLPCPVGQSTNCPTIDVAPNTGVSDGQYVFVTAKNFDPTTSIRVAFCSVNSSATDPTCLNGNWETQLLIPTAVPVPANPATSNLTTLSYPVFLDPSGQGNNLIPAHDLINKNGTLPGFNCDNTTDPCELVVTDEPGQGNNTGNGPTITADNSAVVPITFAAQSAGCPSADPQVNVASSYSLQHFLPAAVKATCAQSDGVTAINVSQADDAVTSDFTGGNATVSFVDNAADPSQDGALLGKGYAYIPIALSGTTESFLAGESVKGQSFPIDSYNLTPNMVAGLVTSLYQEPQGSVSPPPKPHFELADNLVAALSADGITCADLVGCPSTKSKTKQLAYEVKYDAFDLSNAPPAGVTAPASFGSFNANTSSGASYQATSWVCSAPNTPFDVSVAEVGKTGPTTVKVTDTNLAPTTLTSAPIGSSIWPPYAGASWVYPNCSGYSTLPALSATATNFGAAESPDLQAKAMRAWCYGGGVTPVPVNAATPCAAFGLMDTSQAEFYGLSTASLENASGNFVAPSQSSLEAAASAFTPCPGNDLACPAGTYSINYANSAPTAYAMPNITYALVPTGTLSHDEGTAVKNLLTNLVTYSHSASLPTGYAPLPDSIYNAALADISNDISIAPAPAVTTTTTSPGSSTTTTTTSGTSGSSGGSSSDSGTNSYDGTSDTGSGGSVSALPLTAAGSGGGNGPSNSSKTPVAAPPASIPISSLLVALSATTRFLLPAIVVLLLGSLLGGLLLLFGPSAAARRRRDGPGGTS